MNDSSSYLGALACLAALGYGGYWYYTENEASAGMSGKKFYETCWEFKSKGGWGLAFGEAKPSNPYQAAQWMNCETVTVRGMLAAGIIFAEVGEETDPLRRACPYLWFPLVGKYHLYVQETEAAGVFLVSAPFCPRLGASGAGLRRNGRIATRSGCGRDTPKLLRKCRPELKSTPRGKWPQSRVNTCGKSPVRSANKVPLELAGTMPRPRSPRWRA
jgi:hypothetical protein